METAVQSRFFLRCGLRSSGRVPMFGFERRRDLDHDQSIVSRIRGSRAALEPGSGNNPSTSTSDGIYGFHAGAEWEWGVWVLGVQAGLSGPVDECRSMSGIVFFLGSCSGHTSSPRS